MTETSFAEPIGVRLRRWRGRRGWTQQVLADRAGLSRAYVAQIESGIASPERRSTQAKLADALQISVAELLGLPPDDIGHPGRSAASYLVPELRATLIELAAGERRRLPERRLADIQLAAARATKLRMTSDYATLARQLPRLLVEAAAYGADGYPSLVEALFCTRATLRVAGHHDLAREAGRLGLEVARQHDDPAWAGQATYSYVVAMPPDVWQVGYNMSAAALAALDGVSGTAAQETFGFMHLMCALQAAVGSQADTAAEHLREADRLAQRLGEPEDVDGYSGFNGQWFGPTNVALWRVAVAAELEDTAAAVAVRNTIDARQITLANRLGYYHMDMARALAAGGGQDREAIVALAASERAAPQPFRLSPTAVDLVRTLRKRLRTKADPVWDLAVRLGLDDM